MIILFETAAGYALFKVSWRNAWKKNITFYPRPIERPRYRIFRRIFFNLPRLKFSSSWTRRNYRSPMTCTMISKLPNVPVKCEYTFWVIVFSSWPSPHIFQSKVNLCFVFVRRIKLTHFEKFRDTTEALAATTAAVEGKLTKSLKKVRTFAQKVVHQDGINVLIFVFWNSC